MPPSAGLESPPRILSVQSSVVHGYVGNKVSMFPLQLLGFDVSPINTVQLSNHTGYARWTGARFSGAHLHDLIGGLIDNRVADFHYVLTGYAGSVDLLEALADVLPRLKAEAGGALQVFCDPVMGDNGALYVPGEFVDIYRNKIVPIADVLLPNQTEAEFLTGTKIESLSDAARACRRLHELGPATVIITSLQLGSADRIETFVSEGDRCWRFVVDRIPGDFSGTGDAIAALCLAWMRSLPVEKAVSLALATVRAILIRTHAAASTELCLIQSRDAILDPFALAAPYSEPYTPADWPPEAALGSGY